MEHLNGDREWVGEWHLPGATAQVPGLLRYAGGQVRLELLRPFEGATNEGATNVGGSTCRGPVTLLDVIFDTPLHATAYSAVFSPPSAAERVFEASFGFDLLKEWAVPGRPHEDAAKIYDWASRDMLEENAVDKFESRLDDDVRCTLSVSLGTSYHVVEGVRHYHDSWFRIESKRGLPVREIVARYVYPVKHFLMAAMGRPLNLSELHVILDGRPAEVYLPVDRQESAGSEMDHFFNIRGIKDGFDGILRRWFDLHERSPLHMGLLFRTLDARYADELYLYVYATVIEIWNAANSTLKGSDHRRQIKQALEPFEGDFENVGEFAEKIYHIRNTMVHHNPKHRPDYDELRRVTHDLFYLIRVMLLEQCGAKVRHEHGRFTFLKKRSGSKRFPALSLVG